MAALIDQLRQLHADLRFMVEQDPEQEVGGTAVLLVDAVIAEARDSLPASSTLRTQVVDPVSTYVLEHGGESFRAADLLPVVGQLLAVYQSTAMADARSQSMPEANSHQSGGGWKQLEAERQRRYITNRGLFLVHTWRPSAKPEQVAEVSIRLEQHRDGPLSQQKIEGVEYSLGPKFSDHTRVNTNPSHGFQIDESMYGPMLCLARVTFNDGSEPIVLERYINFDAPVDPLDD